MPHLQRTKRHLLKDPECTAYCTYFTEIKKLVEEGYVTKLDTDKEPKSKERWFIQHHMVSLNDKNRQIFNCSFQFTWPSTWSVTPWSPDKIQWVFCSCGMWREYSIKSDFWGMWNETEKWMSMNGRCSLEFLCWQLSSEPEHSWWGQKADWLSQIAAGKWRFGQVGLKTTYCSK